MITNTGKNILAKYLVGQAPAYASYLAFGSGKQPKLPSQTFTDNELTEFSNRQNLEFEMFRSPIISRGYVSSLDEDNNERVEVVLTAEMPTQERYEVTEVGIYSAASNPAAGTNDSRILFSLTSGESWQYDSVTIENYQQNLALGLKGVDSNTGAVTWTLNGDDDSINVPAAAFSANSDNQVFDEPIRISKNERCRFLNSTVFMRGNASSVSKDGQGVVSYLSNSKYLALNGVSVNLERSSGLDQIKVAYSIINKDNELGNNPDAAYIIVEFTSSEATDDPNRQFARLIIDNSEIVSNRYFVETKLLEELEYSTNFSWSSVTSVRVYGSVIKSLSISDQYYIGLDAIRYENNTSKSPIYGMTGYTVIKNGTGQSALPIVKEANTANLVEFRFAMDVM